MSMQLAFRHESETVLVHRHRVVNTLGVDNCLCELQALGFLTPTTQKSKSLAHSTVLD